MTQRQSPYNSPLQRKITQFDQVEKEIHKLKNYLKMKRRVYNEKQFQNINSRIKECEGLVKKEKYKYMKSAAQRVITTSDVNNNLYEEVKEKLALSRKIRVKPKGVGEDKQSSKYNINMKTEQSSFSDQKIVTEYQLVPSRLRERKDMISRVKTMAQEKRENQRYVSQFQKKIKAQLSRLPIEHYNSRKTTQVSPVHNVYRRRKNTTEVIPYRPSTNLKLPPLQI